jgi:ABC-type transport system involved in multi-copper enzyme maturation permease subunit
MSTTIVEQQAAQASPGARHSSDLRVTQWRVIRSEWLKFWSLRSSYYALAATVLGEIAFGTLFAAVTANRWATISPAQRLDFDPTAVSLRGFEFAQLIIGVLGVLVVTGEYSTGMIRASMSAAPKRLPVVWAKSIVFAVVALIGGVVGSIVSFYVGQAFLSTQHISTTLSAPHVLRVVIGTGLYLTVVGLLGVGLGWIIRSTAGAIATLFGILLVLPALGEFLPSSWAVHVDPYLPSTAGRSVTELQTSSPFLSPWAGFGVFCAYAAAAIIIGAVLVRRRDA